MEFIYIFNKHILNLQKVYYFPEISIRIYWDYHIEKDQYHRRWHLGRTGGQTFYIREYNTKERERDKEIHTLRNRFIKSLMLVI